MLRLGVVCLVAGCAHTVPQDRATGPDGRPAGAQKLAVTDQQSIKTRGIVTYPGGDRVDWKRVELPAGKHGTLDLDLTWKPPRPGLKVAFDVFDAWNQPVLEHASSGRRHRSMSIANASGAYLVRVYAPTRGDAGSYTLAAAFSAAPELHEPSLIDIPDPPKLPAVPVDPDLSIAPAPPAPPTPPIAPQPPAPVTPPPPPPAPIVSRIVKADLVGGAMLVTIAGGTERGIEHTWHGTVLTDAGTPLPGGTLTIVRVTKTQTFAKVLLSLDELGPNLSVRLEP